jgi:hypothetical protein
VVTLLSIAGLVATLTFAGLAVGDTVYRYDEAGHLIAVRNSQTDPEACGNPPVVCPDDPHGARICADGYCGVQCEPGWTDAGGRCADTNSDPTACGSGMVSCSVPQHGTATCVQGVCGASCEAGYVATGSSCVSMTSDPLNCGSIGKRCSSVPGYLTCCSASVCGASDGTVCVNVKTDPSNCGWMGHVCAPVSGNPATCSQGRCSKATGTPRVDRVNGVTPPGRVFRSPFWSGLTLSGANLDRVTWVELEDWGADTVDGTPNGVPSVPTVRQVTLPTGSGGPTIHFHQTAATLTVDAASLMFQGAFDPRFQTRRWLKARVHYTASGADRSILTDAAVSLADLVPQDVTPPSITGVASVEARSFAAYDPATGLLSSYDDPTTWRVSPSSVTPVDLKREFPVLRVAAEGLYLAKGLDARQFGTVGWNGSILTLGVFPYDPASSPPLPASGARLIVRGSNLWDDGPLRFTDDSGNVLGGIPVSLFAGNRIVTSSSMSIARRLAFIELASLRGVARTPWMLEFSGTPTLSRIEYGQMSVELENQGGWPQLSDLPLPVGEVVTVVGTWLGNIEGAEFEGPENAFALCDALIRTVWEPVERVSDTPGPNQFRVLDDEHLQLRIDASPATDRAIRGRATYCDCANYCWQASWAGDWRRIHFLGSSGSLYVSLQMQAADAGEVELREKCGSDPPEVPLLDPPDLDPLPPLPDCTNSFCN